MYRVAVVEDEKVYADTLLEFCNRYSSEKSETLLAVHFDNPCVFLEKYKGNYDIVLMDILMPMMEGMECARQLREKDDSVALCFVTNLAQYAIRGYEVGALDFIIKPVTYDVFAVKINRIIRLLKKRVSSTIVLSNHNTAQVINLRDLCYVETFGHDLIFHTTEGNYEGYGDLTSLEKDTRFSRFLRTHHSYLVNGEHVTSFEADTLTVHGEKLPVSRRRRKECFEKLAILMGGGADS